MGGIIDKITDFIKEMLQGWVLSNLETMFTDVNDKVGTIAGEVSQTPSSWNSGIFSMVQTLSENVIVPIAGMIISFVLVYVTEDYRGMIIEATGQFRSYNRHEENHNRLVLSIFAREFAVAEETQEATNTNQIFLDGYICKPPVYRKTPLGREIADILIAVNRPYGKSDYIPCIAWGRNARYAAGFKIGEHIRIWGRVQSREYTKKLDEDTQIKRTAYEVSVSKIECVDEDNEQE